MTSKTTLAFLVAMVVAAAATAFAGDQRVLHADSIQLQSGSNYVQLQAPTLGSNVTFTFPSVSLAFPTSSGTANYVLRTDGAGVTTWVDALTTLHVSDATHSGYLSSTDWVAFNSGIAGSVPTTRTVTTTAPLQGGGDLSANRTLSITQAAAAANGYLGSTDWNTFNNKVSTAESISTTAPLTGGGDLSAPRTLAITQSGAAANGYLSSTDWASFNTVAKVMTAAGDVIYGGVSGAPTKLADGSATQLLHSGATPSWSAVSLTADVTGVLPVANLAGPAATATSGYLSSTDWNTFNTKVGTNRAINTTAPITGGGDLSADRTIAITQAATAANGYLSSTDWNTFSGKLTSPLTTKGDIQTFSTVPARLAAGGNGTVLSADSAQTTGLAWISVLSNPMTTQGDIIYENATPAADRLPKGTATQVLHSGNTPSWSAIVNADVDPAAAIAGSKLAASTAAGAAGSYTPGAQAGYTSGSAIGAGNVGEVLTSTVTSQTFNAAVTAVTSKTLTAGVWMITACVSVLGNQANNYMEIGVSTTTGSFAGLTESLNLARGAIGASNNAGGAVITGYVVNISSPTTYFLNVSLSTNSITGGNATLTAVRIN